MNGHDSNVVQNFILAAAEQNLDFPKARPKSNDCLTMAPLHKLQDVSLRSKILTQSTHNASRSPQRSSFVESFVKVVEHDRIAFLSKLDVPTALAHLAAEFKHCDERHS